MATMTIMTIESVCHNRHLNMRKSLALKPNYVVPPGMESIKSLTSSSIITAVGNFARVVRTSRDRNAIFVFPFSMLMLQKTDTYEIVIKLLEALGVTSKQKQIAVCIDGNVNVALEEMFDSESCTMTLEELQEFRLIITGKIRDEHMFISKDNTTVRLDDTSISGDVYRQAQL
jgi:hypothetical protein